MSIWRISLFLVAFFALFPQQGTAQEIQYWEDFALASDREKVLEKLIPGTQEYYFYHCLHYQNTQQFEKVEQMLKQWTTRYGRTSGVIEIENRQALLTYSNDPKKSLDYIKNHLNLQFNHQKEIPAAERKLPSELNPDLISEKTLEQIARNQHNNTDGFEFKALFDLAQKTLDANELRHLLQRLQYPDIPGLVELINRDLKERDSGGFGSIGIHNQLTIKQLEHLLDLRPQLLNETNFVYAYLTKLQPNDDVNIVLERNEHQAYLERLWEFASRLSPVHNSLKANILYHQLELQRRQGVYDKDRFIQYLQYPRYAPYVNPRYVEQFSRKQGIIDLNANYAEQTSLHPIQNDNDLIRDFLLHFLKDAANTKEFDEYLHNEYLKDIFAEAKIVNGIGNQEQWASMLDPEEFRQLMQRVDIDFALTNPTVYDADQSVKLDVAIKNVENLIVKIFEINTRNYYRTYGREINTNINLDGLVPNHELKFNYDTPPLRRVERTFELPQLDKPGVYVVDFIGNGQSSRVLIRKGELRYMVDTTVAGQMFTITNRKGELVKDAVIHIAGRQYTADKEGFILVPFTNRPTRQNIIICQGELCSFDSFNHQAESYSLVAGFYVDRESLLQGKKASVVVRPSLLLNGIPALAEVLTEVKLTVVSTDLSGIQSRIEFDSLKIEKGVDLVQEFQVPARLNQLQFQLTAKVKNLSRDREESLSAAQMVKINEIDKKAEVQDIHFVHGAEGFKLSIRGKNGEARAKQAVQISLKHEQFTREVSVTLQTDDEGMIDLGKLPGIDFVRAISAGQTRMWNLEHSRQRLYRNIQIAEGESVTVPLARFIEQPKPELFALFELRGNNVVQDEFSKIEIVDNVLLIKDLKRGDYRLVMKNDSREIEIRVVEGSTKAGFIIGKKRTLELRQQNPLRISDVVVRGDDLEIEIGSASDSTRVHVLATHFVPRFDVYSAMNVVGGAEPQQMINPFRPSIYIEGRDIGDEYRYILDRKYQKKYPGNMLTRPSLLLNPWAVRETENNEEQLNWGSEFGSGNDGVGSIEGRSGSVDGGGQSLVDESSLDFLAKASAIAWNLKPDENGKIVIEKAALQGKHHIQLIVLDSTATISTEIFLNADAPELRDIRLPESIAQNDHFTLNKEISVVNPEEKIEINSLLASRMQTYDDISDVYEFYLAKTGDAKLKEFQFILKWPTYDDKKKRELYSQNACHELNVFLYYKDRKFFDTVIDPYLKNKKDSTFIDQWLVKARLDKYVDPWDHARLNVAERIFLGHRDHSGLIARHIADLYALNPTERQYFDALFEAAIAGHGLDRDKLAALTEKSKSIADPSSQPAPGDSKSEESARFDQAGQSRFRGGVAGGGLGGQMGKDFDNKKSADKELGELESDRFSPNARDGIEMNKLEPSNEALSMGRAGRNRRQQSDDALESLDLALKSAEQGQKDNRYNLQDERLSELRKSTEQLYRRVEKTKEWAENNYYHLTLDQQVASLIDVNRFWLEFAKHEGSDPFLSIYFPEACGNFSEMMFALAVLDLPFKAEEHDYNFADNTMTFTAKAKAIVLHQQVQPAIFERRGSNVLVSENFFNANDRYRYEENQRYDKFVNKDFIAGQLYGAQIVITNPTSTPREIDLLIQIPEGSIPVNNSQQTRNLQMNLNAYSTETFEYYFYFPAVGQFEHYPAHVSMEQNVLAVAEPSTFNVIAEPTEIDQSSWAYVSQYGSNDDVIRYLNDNNVQRLELGKIAFRMKDEAMYKRVLKVLNDRFRYDQTLWSYAVYHNDTNAIADFLDHQPGIAEQSGEVVVSEILNINPTDRYQYQHLEYMPLVNARAHSVGKQRKILNPQFYQQYHQLMRWLSYKSQLNSEDRLAVTYYLLLQDRVTEALNMFDSVSKNELATNLQYDYCSAYLAMYRAQPDRAESIAMQYQSYPVDRWRDAFAAVLAQVKEIKGAGIEVVKDDDRDQKQTKLAATDSTFDLKVESRKVELQYQNVKQVTVNYYEMDIELLFSRNPFIDNYAQGFSMIKPNASAVVELPADGKQHTFDLPERFHNSNVLVEIVNGDQVKSQAYYAHSLAVQMSENYGHLQVGDQTTGKVLPSTYVKVYAQMNDGSVKFWKDGYTDLRGRFDYVSLSNQPLDNVNRFSTLVLNEEHGAIVRTAAPPKE